jgi:hypothetical protein
MRCAKPPLKVRSSSARDRKVIVRAQIQGSALPAGFGWRKSEIQEFFADIGAALRKPSGSDYFLGIVVLMKLDDQHLLIIDGQQRITLTCMIYAAIRDRLKRYSLEDAEQAAKLLFDNGGIGRKRGPRLLLSNDQQEFFISHVLDGQVTAPRPSERSAGVKSPNEKRIESAFKQVKEKVSELATSDDKTALSVLSEWDHSREPVRTESIASSQSFCTLSSRDFSTSP